MTPVKITGIYSEAKAYALKGRLLDRTFIEGLASLNSLDALTEKLSTTPYREVLTQQKGPLMASKLEGMLRAHLAIQHHQLAKWFPDSRVLMAYFMRLIGWDMKMVIHAKLEGKSFEEISTSIFLKAEELLKRRELLVKLMAASTIKEGVELLKDDPFYQPLKEALSQYEKRKEAFIFDIFIDREVYRRINDSIIKRKRPVERVDKHFEPFVSFDIDRYNLLTILRAKAIELPPSSIESLIIARKGDKVRLLQKLIQAKSFQDISRILTSLGYGRLIKADNLDEVIYTLERELKIREYYMAKSTFYKRTMSPGVVLAYVKLKELEVENLAKIAFGIEARLPRQDILNRLFFA
jgi:V/A-type H+-transporting ATPase subunit C